MTRVRYELMTISDGKTPKPKAVYIDHEYDAVPSHRQGGMHRIVLDAESTIQRRVESSWYVYEEVALLEVRRDEPIAAYVFPHNVLLAYTGAHENGEALLQARELVRHKSAT